MKSIILLWISVFLATQYCFAQWRQIQSNVSENFTAIHFSDSMNGIPKKFTLTQNYPNPFNPSTTISYSIPHSGHVALKIYDLLGREVQILVNEFQEVNIYSINFDASYLSSGIYFYRLKLEAILNKLKKCC